MPRSVLRGKHVRDGEGRNWSGRNWSGRPPRSDPEDESVLGQKKRVNGVARPRTKALK